MDLSQIMLQNWGDQAASSQVNDRATWNNTLQDIFQKRATLDRYQQETPHYINEKALAGNRARELNTPEMLESFKRAEYGENQSSIATGAFDERTLESKVGMTNQENKTKMVGQAIDNFAQIADLADAAFSKGGDQAVAGLLQQISPELSGMYQQELQQGKSGKQVIGEFKTRIGQIKDQLQVNRSYDSKYYAEDRLQDQRLDSAERIANINASAQDRAGNKQEATLRKAQLTNLEKSIREAMLVLSSGSGIVGGQMITGAEPGTPQYNHLVAYIAQLTTNFNAEAAAAGVPSRFNPKPYADYINKINKTTPQSTGPSLPPGAKLK